MKINQYFQKKLDNQNCGVLPDDLKEKISDDFSIMSLLGIDNIEDQNKFLLIKHHVPEISLNFFVKKLNDDEVKSIAVEVFKNRKIRPINTLLGLIEAIGLALKKMLPDNKEQLKIAYPQPSMIIPMPQYDISKWVSITHQIYSLLHKGYSKEQATQEVIGNWDPREKMDYEQWLKFYKERVPEKYQKLAAFDSNDLFMGGLPVSVLQSKIPSNRMPNPIMNDAYNNKTPPGLPQDDVHQVRDAIEAQRKKLVGRLNSAEKLLSSMDGQLFAGDEQELMLKLLQDLKRRIQTANKRTVKSSLFEDQIYKTANHLHIQGFNKAAGFFYKIAQSLPDLDLPGGDMTGGDMPPMPDEGGSSGDGNKEDTKKFLHDFFEGLKDGVVEEESEEPEPTPVSAPLPPTTPIPPAPAAEPGQATASSDGSDIIKLGNGTWLVKSAQFVPAKEPVFKTEPFRTSEDKKNLEISDKEEAPPDDNTDDLIEAALRNVNIEDVIRRLEMLVSVYNQREISRQLAILDIMMDRIGLASFFPGLGEAMSKALDSNQYIGTRLGDVLAQLKGSIKSPGTEEWMNANKNADPKTAEIRKRLEAQKAEEDQKKLQRKQKEFNRSGPEQKPAGRAEELQQPARIERSPKINVR